MSDWDSTAQALEAALASPEGAGKPDIFRKAYERLSTTDPAPSIDVVRVYLALVRHLFIWGNSFASEKLASRAVALGRAIGEPKILARCLSIQGVMLAELERHAEGVAAYIESLRIAREAADIHRQRSAWLNLGQSFFALEAYTAAQRCTEITLSLTRPGCDDDEEREARAFALGNLGEISLVFGRHEAGLAYVEEGLAVPTDNFDSNKVLNRATMFAVRAKHHIELGKIQLAEQDIASGAALGALSGSRGAVEIEFAQGLLDIAKGNRPVGLNRLHAAVEVTYTKVPGLTGRALVVLARACAKAGMELEAEQAAGAYGRRIVEAQNAILLGLATDPRLPLDPWSARETSLSLAGMAQRSQVPLEGFGEAGDVKVGSAGDVVQDLLDNLGLLTEQKLAPRMQDHGIRVGRIARTIGRGAGLDEASLAAIERAASWHGIGFAAIPRFLLEGDGASQAKAERNSSLFGEQMLDGIDFETVKIAARICRNRNCRWDGQGDAGQPMGQAIPFVARLTAVADAFDMGLQSVPRAQAAEAARIAFRIVQASSGTHLDPELVGVLGSLVEALIVVPPELERMIHPAAPKRRLVMPKELGIDHP